MKKDPSAITIPEFNHSSIETILKSNQLLIKIIKDSQDYGWLNPEDVKLYQMKLSRNLLFLASLLDSVKQNPFPPAPVPKSTKLKPFASAMDIIEELPAPIMVVTPDPNQKTEFNFPPLVSRNPISELQNFGLQILDEDTSRKLLHARCFQPARSKSTKRVSIDVDMLNEYDNSSSSDVEYCASEDD